MKKKSIFSVSNLLLVFFMAVFIYAAVRLVLIYVGYHQADSEYAHLEENYVKEVSRNVDQSTNDDETSGMNVPFMVDFESLLKENEDTIGWVYVGACDISYPIVQTGDNDFYLTNTFEKQVNSSGAIFADFENSSDFTDYNTFVYGHNMKNGSMFGKLKKLYREDTLWGEDPYFYIFLKDGTVKKYYIFSYYITTDDSDSYTQPLTEDAMTYYMEKVKSRSSRSVDISDYADGTPIVSLSTCSGRAGGNQRLLVHGILCETGHQ
ncbi:MAG: class B sortase [Lachnospiraceae bacterium]|nr:class B sortase [Lachnospiraceae bacterium]